MYQYQTINLQTATVSDLKAALKEARDAGLTGIDLRASELTMLKEIKKLRSRAEASTQNVETVSQADKYDAELQEYYNNVIAG